MGKIMQGKVGMDSHNCTIVDTTTKMSMAMATSVIGAANGRAGIRVVEGEEGAGVIEEGQG